jgi:hypothetical protein
MVGSVLGLAALLAATSSAAPLAGLKPAEPQPTAQQLAPGLAVQYTYGIVNHVDELTGRKFEPGPPLPNLDYRNGYRKVMTAKSNEGVGALIDGFVRFDKPGVYGLDVTSNDGVRVELGGKLLHEDPGVHVDTTSDRIDVKIDQAGWYPLHVVYFQKRNTSTLVLRWTGPGGGGKLLPVPPQALAHRK